ncbi:hypothetical protein [Candidatus Williamhamiltonella defendens]|uniref:hypothetical protein n=1 Tax=Candidatus Williamhamiltonella defendens TaxID=138072 RepID=UPI0002FE1644|nr:hypothetical protein [Candidatus Hamiltonella defensa]
MSQKMNRIILSTILILLTGCAVSPKKDYQPDAIKQESVLIKSKNYPGLIALYRNLLQKKEDSTVRLKLSEFYYLSGDNDSSLYYLEPLVSKSHDLKQDEKIHLLHVKNLIKKDRNEEAQVIIENILKNNIKSAEWFNLYGIALANTGSFLKAENAFKQSRDLFISDSTVLNNFAVLAILKNDYKKSISFLLPEYLNGNKDPKLIHNLIFCLVQIKDNSYAKKIIEMEKISDYPDKLIKALSQISQPNLSIKGKK